MKRLLLVLSLLVAPLARAADAPPEITVYAAASLTDALGELGKTYEAMGKGKIVASYASSSDLARQIEHGAPADLFVSADQQWADYLDQRGLLDKATRIDLLRNELVLVAPAASAATLAIAPNFKLAEALGDSRLAVGDPDHVPAGIYARQSLEHLGIWSAVEPKLARAGSVRAALLFVERGDCPFGIVYRSDAQSDSKVKVIGVFPETSHSPVVYPAALVTGHHSAAAVEFLHFLTTPEAMAVFQRYGFGRGSAG
ncbi:MAG TPA: molybdate ABC transporter substrate-binding protein [Magnetospirillaceae bacterium]|nr:molybdate ABC transporter substrate-binding protein [Magnetospirillaceae bacterium]